MNSIVPQEIAIVGITYQPKWYSGKLKSIKHTDKIRGDLILYALRFAMGVGYSVVVVDGGSAKTFVSEIKKMRGIRLFQSKVPKRSPNRRRAIFEASKMPSIKAIVMTEIEKVSVITDCIEQIVRPILFENVDIVIPKRELSLFEKTYPDYMFESEVEGNLLYNESLRAHGLLSVNAQELDLFFGVRVFKNDRKMLKAILSKYASNTFSSLRESKLFDLEQYSDSQFFPVVKALKNKLKVVSVTIPFRYPEKQKQNEETGDREHFILKRKYQKVNILIELMHFLGYLEGNKTRKIELI